ncbi:MAG: ABC transporter ATP-binding protein [Oribacterium sp.]
MKRLLACLSDYKLQSLLAPLFKCLEACFELLVPAVISSMIDRGIGGAHRDYVLRMGAMLLLLALIGLVCSITAQYFAAMVASHSGKRLREELFRHINTLGYAELDELGVSTLITRMTADINQIENGVNMLLRLFMRSPFIVFGAVVMAFRISVRASLIFLLTVPLLMGIVFGIMLLTMPRYRNVQQRLDRVMKVTRENLLGVRVVRAFNRQQSEKKEFKEENDLLTYLQVQVGKLSALLNPLTYVVINLSIVALLHSGARLVNTGALTQGGIVALVNYMSQILVELIKLANLIILMTRAYASLSRVDAVFTVESKLEKSCVPEREDGAPHETGASCRARMCTEGYAETAAGAGGSGQAASYLRFRDVSFRYGEGQENVLSGISLCVERGQTVGIIGGTGSGKTTLIQLLPRFYERTEGEITLDGQDIRKMDIQALRQRIGLVPQRSVLFAGTLRENLRWGREDVTEEEMFDALRTAQAYDFVMEKGEGLDMQITQEGRNLSGGQKQRLCIARALVRRPEILILDDAASALDFATDYRLRRAIREDTGDTTVFLVSQRVSTVRAAEQILVLDDGRMAGLGTHRELFECCEVYREICLSQLSVEENKD